MRSLRVVFAVLALSACGDVQKLPDAAVPDVYVPDGPPMEVMCGAGEMVCNGTCANLMTNDRYCGSCGTECSPTQGCLNGACTDRASKCTSIRVWDPAAPDGVYFNPNTQTSMYCDFTNGFTYEGLGLGQFNASYGSNWALMSSAQLNDAAIQKAFIGLYNAQNGLINLAPGLSPGNCCFKSSDAGAGAMLIIANHHLYPAKVGADQVQCGGPYNDLRYRFYEAETGPYAPLPLPDDYWAARPAAVQARCSDGNNPGIFIRRRAGLN